MNLTSVFHLDDFRGFISGFLPGFAFDERKIDYKVKGFSEVRYLGQSEELKTSVLIVYSNFQIGSRISLTNSSFRILKNYGIFRALVVYINPDERIWRFSLLTAQPTWSKGRVIEVLSNPQRHSFVLGDDVGVATANRYLLKMGKISSFEDLQSRFSVEVVNSQFYADIAGAFRELVGLHPSEGSGHGTKPSLTVKDSDVSQSQIQEYAVRLIGRIVFCWFLKEKRSIQGIPLVPSELFDDACVVKKDVLHTVLEPLFFEALNKPIAVRKSSFASDLFRLVPYLNGGLFKPVPGVGGDYYDDLNPSATVTVLDSWFVSFFAKLRIYNFTVDENTSFDIDLSVDPEMLGRIFENLLAEINPETGETARKNTGSYYTPRSVVAYMVDASLLGYLKGATSIDEKKLKSLISYESLDDLDIPVTEKEKVEIAKSLKKFKALDPACGSGAFPIGLLQKIVWMLEQVDPESKVWLNWQIPDEDPDLERLIRQRLTEKSFAYVRKLSVIRDSIYGVDIQPIATEIAKLRCFLTLVVEEEVDDFQENRGIQPLPNLDFKFVTANSLVNLTNTHERSESYDELLFDEEDEVDELRRLRNDYFGAGADERSFIEDEFRSLQKKLAGESRERFGIRNAQYVEELGSWNPFGHVATNWFDPEWMFGLSKFDLVISNPPYIGEKGHKELFSPIKKTSLGRFYNGKMDLFYFFIHLGIDLTRKDGVICVITTNYFPTADSALKLRRDIASRTRVIELINFNTLRIFDSAAGQHNMITILRNGAGNDLAEIIFVPHQEAKNTLALSQVLNKDGRVANISSVEQEILFDGEKKYIRFSGVGESEDSIEISIMNKMAQDAVLLGDVFEVRQGIITGVDKFSQSLKKQFPQIKRDINEGIFVLEGTERENSSLRHYFRPWYKNSDISRWATSNETDKVVIYLDGSKTPRGSELKNLKSYIDILEDRIEVQEGKMPWWRLHRPREQHIFEGKKIVAPQRSSRNCFAYNDSAWYASADVYYIYSSVESYSLFSLLALLNSDPFFMWLYFKGKKKGEMLELYATPLKEVPIPSDFQKYSPGLARLSREAIKYAQKESHEKLKEIEGNINEIVMEMLDLNAEEIEFLDSWKKSHISE